MFDNQNYWKHYLFILKYFAYSSKNWFFYVFLNSAITALVLNKIFKHLISTWIYSKLSKNVLSYLATMWRESGAVVAGPEVAPFHS